MFCTNKDVEFQIIDENTKRKVLVHDGKMMGVEVHFAQPTETADLHSHPHEQLSYVLKGSFKFIVGDEEKVVNVGDTIYMPGDVKHGCQVLEAGSVVYDVFTPQREDFLKK